MNPTLKADFPILNRSVNGHPLIYLDSAATSQKPQSVITALVEYYSTHNANVHRGIHTLGDESTQSYMRARAIIAAFIGAKPEEIILVRNTTEALNLFAATWGEDNISKDDEILVTELEHHSNLLPWQRLATRKNAKIVHLPITDEGLLDVENLHHYVTKKTKLAAVTATSNVLGSRVNIPDLVARLNKINKSIRICVDGAQAVPHEPVNVAGWGADCLAFSGHKMVGPMGIGVLWVKEAVLKSLEPVFVGGGMINSVSRTTATWADLPERFDAGTPDVAGAVGLAAACQYLNKIGLATIHNHEQTLISFALEQFMHLESQGKVTVYGPKNPKQRAGILTFNVTGVHAHDAAQILDREAGLAVRSGHHCNQILTEKLGVPATVRASFYLYNTQSDIEKLVEGIEIIRKVMRIA